MKRIYSYRLHRDPVTHLCETCARRKSNQLFRLVDRSGQLHGHRAKFGPDLRRQWSYLPLKTRVKIRCDVVRDITESNVSLMPEKQLDSLTARELRDLYRYSQ
jgi:hypothetical protein